MADLFEDEMIPLVMVMPSPYGDLSEESNVENRDVVHEYWMLGPEKASEDPEANSAFWSEIGAAWRLDEASARRRTCSNCEYFDNTPKALEAMDVVPYDEYDMDGGGRGYCHEFQFICHSLRTCQEWEEKEYEFKD